MNGESDEHGIVNSVLDGLYWENAIIEDKDGEMFSHTSTFNYKDREWFIKYLEALPTIRHDSKINKILKMSHEYY